MDKKYPKFQALKVIQRIIREGGELYLSSHYMKRMRERDVGERCPSCNTEGLHTQ